MWFAIFKVAAKLDGWLWRKHYGVRETYNHWYLNSALHRKTERVVFSAKQLAWSRYMKSREK